ncbi:MAG: hypothetical protein JKY88_03115 [Pseudomonadales bacterium]|nr:hypothetical protein [Pseudomonadales bacterium]
MSHSLEEVHSLFEGFEIEGFDIRDFDGKTVTGVEKHWHIFTVVAVRRKLT